MAAVLAAAFERSGPPPALPVGDVVGRRVALDAMLGYFNNEAQPAGKVDISDHRVVAPDGAALLARWYRQPSGDSRVHPHPAPVEDAYAGLVWLADHAAELGVDPGRIAVMGDSAGGGLAAGVAILSRDRKGPAVARQLLVYPMLDGRTTTPDPYIAPLAGWSYDDNATGWNALLGPGHEHREVDPSAAPGRLQDAAGLPPAYIEVGQLDIFRDEAVRSATPTSTGTCGRTRIRPSR